MKKIVLIMTVVVLTLLSLFAETKTLSPRFPQIPLALTEIWTSSGGDEAPLSEVGRLRVSDQGEIFVSDRKHHKIFVFSPDGVLLRSFGKKGEGPGESRMLIDIHLSANRLFIVDMNAIHTFDHQGKFLQSRRFTESENIMPLFFLDDDQFVYSPRKPMEKVGKNELKRYDLRTGTAVTLLNRGTETREEVMPGMQGGRILIIGSGSYRDNEGLLSGPGADGSIIWNFNGSPDLVVMDQKGQERNRFAALGAKRRPIEKAAKEAAVKRMRININGGTPPKEMLDRIAASFGDQTTYYYSLVPGPSWAPLAAGISEFGRRDGILYDLFTQKGDYVCQTEWKVPEGCEMGNADPVFHQDRFYAVFSDEDGNIELHAYQVKPPVK